MDSKCLLNGNEMFFWQKNIITQPVLWWTVLCFKKSTHKNNTHDNIISIWYSQAGLSPEITGHSWKSISLSLCKAANRMTRQFYWMLGPTPSFEVKSEPPCCFKRDVRLESFLAFEVLCGRCFLSFCTWDIARGNVHNSCRQTCHFIPIKN